VLNSVEWFKMLIWIVKYFLTLTDVMGGEKY